jgi:hypothetical protein
MWRNPAKHIPGLAAKPQWNGQEITVKFLNGTMVLMVICQTDLEKPGKTELLGQGKQSLGVPALFCVKDWFTEYEMTWD